MSSLPPPRPSPTRKLPERNRGMGVEDPYKPEDRRPIKEAEPESEPKIKKAKRDTQFDTSPKKLSAAPRITLTSDPTSALLPPACFPALSFPSRALTCAHLRPL